MAVIRPVYARRIGNACSRIDLSDKRRDDPETVKIYMVVFVIGVFIAFVTILMKFVF